MRNLHILSMAVISVAVSGCSDPKAANETNFKVAMQSYLDTTYPKCYFVENFPKTVESYGNNDSQQSGLKALTKAGMLAENEVERKELKSMFGDGPKVMVKSTFDLTDEGRKAYKPDATKNFRGDNVGGFCFGKATVKTVTQFSEPADLFGHRVSQVRYEYIVGDLPKWITSADMTASSKVLKMDAESNATPVKAMQAAVLTNNGWVHEKLFKK